MIPKSPRKLAATLLCLCVFLAGTGSGARADGGLPLSAPSPSPPNYHLVGWFNTAIPGGGQLLLGNYGLAGLQAGLELSTVLYGYSLSNHEPFTLDGSRADLPSFDNRSPRSFNNTTLGICGDMLQEFGIKYHMVNVYDSYREAAPASVRLDREPTTDLFFEPFKTPNLENPWVWVPLTLLTGLTVLDYYTSRNSQPRQQPLDPYSNFLYFSDYSVVESIGSGAPEEMFYRGFLQNEFYSAIPSPYFAIPAQSVLFAFSHGPGNGRISSGVAGLYLGFLADHFDNKLAPGITLHFWGSVILGLESVLLSHFAQRATPPAALSLQINY